MLFNTARSRWNMGDGPHGKWDIWPMGHMANGHGVVGGQQVHVTCTHCMHLDEAYG